jgi:hypothetical protein
MIKREYERIKLPVVLHDFINNPRVDLKSKGLLMYLLLQQDDFDLNTKDLSLYNKDAASTLASAIKDLERLGYIEVINRDTPKMSYIIYDTPQLQVSTKFKDQERIKKAADKATKTFIKNYLTPDRHFKRDRSIDTYLHEMQNPEFDVDWEYIEIYIRDMLSYEEFLLTEYWEIISIWKKIHSNFICQNCGKKYTVMSKLNIHHHTYESHGREHIPYVLDNDLVCWCEDCHKEYHMNNSLQNM